MKKVIKLIVSCLLMLLIISIIPVNFLNKNFESNRQIHVTGQQCTACSEVRIVKGTIEIPESFKKGIKTISQSDLTLIGNSPFLKYDMTKNYNFFVENDFLVEGKVVGIDSIHFDSLVPIYEVSTWKTVNYVPIFWTF